MSTKPYKIIKIINISVKPVRVSIPYLNVFFKLITSKYNCNFDKFYFKTLNYIEHTYTNHLHCIYVIKNEWQQFN